jgi:hypothetical protein
MANPRPVPSCKHGASGSLHTCAVGRPCSPSRKDQDRLQLAVSRQEATHADVLERLCKPEVTGSIRYAPLALEDGKRRISGT